MAKGRRAHTLGESKCDVCHHTITSFNAVFMRNRLRGRCKDCFSHEAGGNDKRVRLYNGTESAHNPFGGKGKVLMR